MAPLSANLDGLVPPAFEIPSLVLASHIVESVLIKDIEGHVIGEFAGSRAYRTASFVVTLSLRLNGHGHREMD